MKDKQACKLTEEIRQTVAQSVRFLESAQRGQTIRAAAKRMNRAVKMIRRKTPGVWSAAQTSKIAREAEKVTGKLYSMTDEDNPTAVKKKAAALLAAIERVGRQCR